MNCLIGISLFFNLSLLANTTCSNNFYVDEGLENRQILKESVDGKDLHSYHFFSHGRSGELLLNGKWLDASQISQWIKKKGLLKNKKHLNIYACKFAQGEKGKAAISYLEMDLGISIAASDDVTGKDGDWDLEVGTPSILLDLRDYPYNLQDCCQSHGDHNHISRLVLKYVGPTNNANISVYSSYNGSVINYSATHQINDLILLQAPNSDGRMATNVDFTVAGNSFEVHASCSQPTNLGMGISNNGSFINNPNPAASDILFIIEGIATPDGCSSGLISPCVIPNAATPTSTQGTCTGTTINNNATITLNSITNADVVGIVIGTNYVNGIAYNVNANSSSALYNTSGGNITFSNLIHNTSYTIRVFNGSNNCYLDLTTLTAPIACNANCDISAQAAQSVYNDSGTPSILTDDTFTTQITVNGTGSTGWSGGGQSGNYGTTVIFGPYPVNQGTIFTIQDNINLNCTISIGTNMNSCTYMNTCPCCSSD